MSPRSAVLIDLDRAEPHGVRWRRVALIGAATLLIASLIGQEGPTSHPAAPASVVVATLAPRAQLATLALPASLGDVQLFAFPDWLANEPPPATLRGFVAVRGTMGITSVEGVTIVNWTERGISYWLESTSRTVPELVAIAEGLR